MKYCPFCGAGLQDIMAFCPKCGKEFLDGFENSEVIGQPNKSKLSGLPRVRPKVINNTNKPDSIQTKEPVDQPKSKNNKGRPVLLSVIVIIAIVSLLFFGKNHNRNNISISEAANSVLYIEAYDDENNMIASASGFVIESGDTLITNYHVIDDAHHIIAYTPDGEKSTEIHIVLTYNEVMDLAVLQCEENIGVKPLLLGNSDKVEQGDKVYAVGYPLGLANTLSDGVISSHYLNENNIDVLQITAAISSGSSGGALLNEEGQVIGIICASYVDGQNLNIAISVNELTSLLLSKSQTTTLDNLYEQRPHPYALEYILENRQFFNGKDVQIEAYISSAVIFNMDGDSWADYVIVSNESDILGYIGYGYSEDFFEDADYIKYYGAYEDGRIESYKALGFELMDTNIIYKPGEKIIVSGVLEDIVYVDEVHDIDWSHVILRTPKIIE